MRFRLICFRARVQMPVETARALPGQQRSHQPDPITLPVHSMRLLAQPGAEVIKVKPPCGAVDGWDCAAATAARGRTVVVRCSPSSTLT